MEHSATPLPDDEYRAIDRELQGQEDADLEAGRDALERAREIFERRLASDPNNAELSAKLAKVKAQLSVL